MSGAGRRAAIKAHLDANGRLDQLEDRLSGTQEAGGSNPPVSTNYCSDTQAFIFSIVNSKAKKEA